MTCCNQTRMTVLALIAASQRGISYEVAQAIIDTHAPDGPCERCCEVAAELREIRKEIIPGAAVEPIVEVVAKLLL